jgi:hypothetical protein
MRTRAHTSWPAASILALLLGGCVLDDEEPISGWVDVGGERDDEAILAEVRPDPETRIQFVRGQQGDDGQARVDVVFTGRDGGLDYGSLISDAGATPLELYLALADPSADAPEELRLAHDRETRITRNGDTQVRAPAAKLAAAAPGVGDWDNFFGLSTYTCKSWDNFLDQMSKQFAGAPGRHEVTQWADTPHTLYNPSANSSWNGGRTDIYVCNYNSAGNTPDEIRAHLCDREPGPAGLQRCFHTTLPDGWYARKLYGPAIGLYKYWGAAEPLPAGNILLSFIGIIHRN